MTMSSNLSIPGKSLTSSSSSTTYSATSSPGPSTSHSISDLSRRQAASPSHSQGAPRKQQGSRKQHRAQRRAGGPMVDDDDNMAEIRALRNASSRRGQTSITHLMSYAHPPRPQLDSSYNSHSRSYRRNPTWGPGSGHHAADKARYVHANYRFVVSPTGNYSAQAVDADEHVEWSDVMQVIASTESQQTSCPICLSEPVAPRMAKCGHIYCLPCLMRFMNSTPHDSDGSSTDRKQTRWRKCAICEDAVFLSDVRPVRFYAGQESPLPRPGDDVVLRLMVRNAHSTLALPKEGGSEVLCPEDGVPWHFAATVLDYARVMRGTGEYMLAQFESEIQELEKQANEDELLFHEGGEWTQRAVKAINLAKEKVRGLGESEAAAIPAGTSAGQSRPTGYDFYFYTSPPHLYLSPLDIRILKTKYGSFSAFPSALLPRVEHISTGHPVDDGMRKRAKYLSHLPRGCLISFLECDWTDIVPGEILETFKDEIERRRKRNHDKAAQEERERIQAERADAAAIRPLRRYLGSVDEDVRFSAPDPYSSPIDLNDFRPLEPMGATPPNPRPGFNHLQDLSTSPSAPRTVWGTAAIPPSPEMRPTQNDEPVDDGWLRDNDVLGTLETAELGAQKKKKKQVFTLMSNGGRRGN